MSGVGSASGGILLVKSGQQLIDEENAAAARVQSQVPAIPTGLVGHINAAWEVNRQAKIQIEERLLACLRAKQGVYSKAEEQEILSAGGTNLVYMMLTATKARAAASWIADVLLPTDDRAWSVTPTPEPELPQWVNQMVAKRAQARAMQMQAEGEEVTQATISQIQADLMDHVKKSAKELAEDAARRMSDRISDAMEEGGWREAMEEFIDDFTTYPTAFLKGPIIRARSALKWGNGFQPQVQTVLGLEWERVSPFDLYPSPQARTLQDGDLIEHVRFTRSQLHAMIGQDGYQEDAIRQVLTDHVAGLIHHWMWNDAERTRLETGSFTHWKSPTNIIDGLCYWGSASGLMLLSLGMDPERVPDPIAQYEIEAILIGSRVVYCEINQNPLAERPYHCASYQKTPGSVWGQAPGELMKDTQKVCNATARALCDNMAIASGPQVSLEVDRLPPEEQNIEAMYPWKIWQVKSDPAGSTRPAVQFFQPSINSSELLLVYEQFERRADDETNIPRYSYGNERVGGAGQTASGLSMLMDATSKGIRKAIGNIDFGVIRKSVRQSFIHFMLYDPDPSIKGDCNIVPRGSAALIIKEQARLRRQEFLAATTNPIDMQIIGVAGRAELLRESARALDMPVDKIVPPREDIERRLKAQADQPPPELAAEQLRGENALKLAQVNKQADMAMNQGDNQTALQIAVLRTKQLAAQRKPPHAST